MKFIKLLLVALSVTLSTASVLAEERLGLYITPIDNDCPFNQKQLESRVEGEFLRARLKPDEQDSAFLYVKVQCLKTHAGDRHNGYIVASNIAFAIGEGQPQLLFLDDYGTVAIGGTGESGKQFLLNVVVEGTSNAITDFLKATL
ncbi:hypothetical protein [Vibrio agarivorans]|uniref:hypothetical protein n=1 Tax=Vibrio agarivorans TaxID=153622 RepID=UPI0022312070|nr:hypothetical protein [Vibrio agarivorans]